MQSPDMGFGGLLKSQDRFAAIAAVSVTTEQEVGFGNEDAVFILTYANAGDRDDHEVNVLPISRGVNRLGWP